MAEADELDFAKLRLDVLEDWIAGVMTLADAVTEKGVVVDTAVELDGPEVPRGFAKSIDVGVEAEGIRLGVEFGVVEAAVVEGGAGFDVLDVGGITTGGVLVSGGLAGVDVLDNGGW